MSSDNIIHDFEKSYIRRAKILPSWLPDSTSIFWYRKEIVDDKYSFILVDCERGIYISAFDHIKLAAKLSNAENQGFWTADCS